MLMLLNHTTHGVEKSVHRGFVLGGASHSESFLAIRVRHYSVLYRVLWALAHN